jgi:hypothetical protein
MHAGNATLIRGLVPGVGCMYQKRLAQTVDKQKFKNFRIYLVSVYLRFDRKV